MAVAELVQPARALDAVTEPLEPADGGDIPCDSVRQRAALRPERGAPNAGRGDRLPARTGHAEHVGHICLAELSDLLRVLEGAALHRDDERIGSTSSTTRAVGDCSSTSIAISRSVGQAGLGTEPFGDPDDLGRVEVDQAERRPA